MIMITWTLHHTLFSFFAKFSDTFYKMPIKGVFRHNLILIMINSFYHYFYFTLNCEAPCNVCLNISISFIFQYVLK